MMSDISFILKFIHQYDQSALEQSTPNGTPPHRLLSPIIENSVEKKSPRTILTDDETNRSLLEKFQRSMNHFEQIQMYLNRVNEHFHALSFLIQRLRHDENVNESIEFLEIRLIQMRVKRDQIDRSLNQSSLQNLIKQVRRATAHSSSSSLFASFFPDFSTSSSISIHDRLSSVVHIHSIEYESKDDSNRSFEK